MVWPFNRNKNSQENTGSEATTSSNNPAPAPAPAQRQQFLEDLPPKFEDAPGAHPPKPSISGLLKNISLDDFRFSKLVEIPCFREAGISGFTAMAALGTVMFFYHKNVNKAVNWAYGGFFIGSVFGWEQCNSVRRQSQATASLAKLAYEERQKQKLAEKYKEFLESKKNKD